jgi:hypothetical protein
MVRMLPPTLGTSARSCDLQCIHDLRYMDVSHACGRLRNRSSFSSIAYLLGLLLSDEEACACFLYHLGRSVGRLLDTFQASNGAADQTQSTKLTVSLSDASFPNAMLWDTWSMDECRLISQGTNLFPWRRVGFTLLRKSWSYLRLLKVPSVYSWLLACPSAFEKPTSETGTRSSAFP